ncbi:uncharacterized protein LOC120289703 [Eucalyptus grandis]|uniref:uncharacterized protein LOC120289703 n=1 Tax=Eucalyptus grandis TaxID=71139 RepID=UPI00192EC42F|nr:uncharacterized protein LOC120289703 [Eucalyptus grandis]
MDINEKDDAGNTALHLAAMHSQPATLIRLVLDERIDPFLLNHQPSTTLDIAIDRVIREYMLRKKIPAGKGRLPDLGKLGTPLELDAIWATLCLSVGINSPRRALTEQLTVMALASTCEKSLAGTEAFSIIDVDKRKPNMDQMKNLIGNRSVVATLVASVTFAVPGGFNSLDTASKGDRGMATMLDDRMLRAFAISNTIAMFCLMTAVITLLWAQQKTSALMIAYRRSMPPLKIALPAMCAAFLTGVTLTVGKLSRLANTILYLGLVFLLIVSVAKLLEDPPLIWSHRRPIRIMVSWLVLAHIYLWGVVTDLLDDSEEDRTAGWTSASELSDDVCKKND